MGVNGIYGLSGSGLDIESMVKVGMMGKQNEYDKMLQKFTKNQWLKENYLDLSNKITTFNSSTLSQYKMSTNMNPKGAESSNSAVKASANSSAALMTHKVDVEKLSSNAYLVGTHEMTRYDTSTGNELTESDANYKSIKLADVLFSKLNVSDGKVSGNIAVVSAASKDADWTVTKSDGSTAAKDGAGLTSETSFGEAYAETVDYQGIKTSEVAFQFAIYDGTQDEATKDMDSAQKAAYKQAHTISYTYDDLLGENGVTFNDLVSKINSLGLNVKASYDSVNDRFSFYNSKGGADNTIQIELGEFTSKETTRSGVATRNFFNNMGLYRSENGNLIGNDGNVATQGDSNSLLFELKHSINIGTNPDGTTQYSTTTGVNSFTGEDGNIIVDGVSYKTTDNQTTVNGVTYTALDTTGTTDSSGVFQSSGAATISVTQDTDTIIDKVKSFVKEYNTLLADLYKKYDEKPNSDYKPLTQAQKDQMKEDQITKWEEKAKSGLLYHDQTLGKVIMNLRNSVAEAVEGVEGKYNSMFSLGISTTGIKGQLVLDEDKLKKALAEDPDAAYNVFAKLDSKDLNNSSKSGVAQRLSDIFVDATKSIKERAGSSSDITEDSDLNDLLRNLQTKMSNFRKQMTSFENALYKKYDAMESMLAKLGAQFNYVMGSTGQ